MQSTLFTISFVFGSEAESICPNPPNTACALRADVEQSLETAADMDPAYGRLSGVSRTIRSGYRSSAETACVSQLSLLLYRAIWMDRYLRYVFHDIETKLPLWTCEQVGKVGMAFPTFILEVPGLQITFRNKGYYSDMRILVF